MATSLASFVPEFSIAGANSYIYMLVYGLLFFGGILVLIMVVRNFLKFKYYAVVHRIRQNDPHSGKPTSAILRGKAGYFYKKGRDVFVIKYGMMPWQRIQINKLPNPKYMEDNVVTFIQYNVGELTQAKTILNWKMGDVEIQPVESSTKAAAKQELKELISIFNIKSKLQENSGILIMGFVLIAGIIAFYFISKACG